MPRPFMILGATLLLAGCDSAPDARPPLVVPNPSALLGTYELWICGTADCGPTATTPGSRSGRLQLTADRVPVMPTDSSVAYHGCAMIGPLVKVDTATALTAIRWRPGETAGRVMFAMVDSPTSEYDITLDDLGGMLKGEARWRREGVLSDEAPDHVVARRSATNEKVACVAAPVVPAPTVKKSVAAPKPAKKKG